MAMLHFDLSIWNKAQLAQTLFHVSPLGEGLHTVNWDADILRLWKVDELNVNIICEYKTLSRFILDNV